MLRSIVETATRFLAWLYRHQMVQPAISIVKVNLGSGLSVAPGWINVEGSLSAWAAKMPAPIVRLSYKTSSVKVTFSEAEYVATLKTNEFVFHDLAYGVPFLDNSVDYFYSAHMLEHLFRDQAERLLRDAWRALKRGGTIRIGVPDLEYAFMLYQRGQKEQALGFFFMEPSSGHLGQHHYLYDFELLKGLLSQVGFVQIERCVFQSGATPDLVALDNRPVETLFVEARK